MCIRQTCALSDGIEDTGGDLLPSNEIVRFAELLYCFNGALRVLVFDKRVESFNLISPFKGMNADQGTVSFRLSPE